MKQWLTILSICCVGLFLSSGCGGGDEETTRSDLPNESLDVQETRAARGTVEELQDALNDEGVQGLKQIIGDLMESFEDAIAPSGPNAATINSINDGVKELNTFLAGSPSQADVQKKIDDLAALANKLPGGESTE